MVENENVNNLSHTEVIPRREDKLSNNPQIEWWHDGGLNLVCYWNRTKLNQKEFHVYSPVIIIKTAW